MGPGETSGSVEVRASRLRHWGAREALRVLGGVTIGTALLGLTLALTAGAKVATSVSLVTLYLGVLVGGITAAIKAARPIADAPATVRATPEGLFVDGALVASRAEISSGTVMPETVEHYYPVSTDIGTLTWGVHTTLRFRGRDKPERLPWEPKS